MSTLSLDQSFSSTGFVIEAGGLILKRGAFPLSEGKAMRGQGFRVLFLWLDAHHKEFGFDTIVHEEVLKLKKDHPQKLVGLYGLVAVIELFAASRGIDTVIAYPSAKWRETFFSKEERVGIRVAAADDKWKQAAKARAEQLGYECRTDDEAEAFAILDHHLHALKIKPPWREANPFLPTVA